MDLAIYDTFVECYNNPSMTADDVKRRCNLNGKRYAEIKELAINNHDISPVRSMNRSNAKFYTKNGDSYIVKKQFGTNCLLIGRFPSEAVAEEIVEKCKEVNWNISEIQDFIDAHKIKPRNYSFSNGSYIVQKAINGKNTVFCRVDSEDIAKKVVEKLRKYNWDASKTSQILAEVI